MKTVSRVVNKERNVAEETRQQVLQTIQEMGYVPDSSAQGLRTRSTRLFGLVIPSLANPIFEKHEPILDAHLKKCNAALAKVPPDLAKRLAAKLMAKQKAEGKRVVTDADERRWVHDRYMNELIPAVFRAETRERMLALVARMKARDGIEGVILGGTVLPLLLQDAGRSGIPFLDTTRIHAERAVAHMLAPGAG